MESFLVCIYVLILFRWKAFHKGKSHLSIALGQEAINQGYNVKYYTVAHLSNELMEAQDEKRLLQLEKQWLTADVTIVDELGYIRYHQRAAELLFQFFSARYERGSMIITSNREFSKWVEVFHDEQMTAALLGRVTHKAHVIPMNGEDLFEVTRGWSTFT